MGKRGRTGEHSKKRGPESPFWKGGRQVDRYGYLYVWVGREHPMANLKGRVAEHRLIMANKLGRMIRPDEIVHHINGDKLDNRPENLELTTRQEHPSHHLTWNRCAHVCAKCGKHFVPKRKPRSARSICSRICKTTGAEAVLQ